jgi:hypothetical protein
VAEAVEEGLAAGGDGIDESVHVGLGPRPRALEAGETARPGVTSHRARTVSGRREERRRRIPAVVGWTPPDPGPGRAIFTAFPDHTQATLDMETLLLKIIRSL